MSESQELESGTSSFFEGEVDGPSTHYGPSSEQSVTSNGSGAFNPSSGGSVGSQQSYGYHSGQSSGSSILSQTHRANAVGSALPAIRHRSAGQFVPGSTTQRNAIMDSNDKAELEYYRQMAQQARGAPSRGRGTYGRGSPGGRGNQP